VKNLDEISDCEHPNKFLKCSLIKTFRVKSNEIQDHHDKNYLFEHFPPVVLSSIEEQPWLRCKPRQKKLSWQAVECQKQRALLMMESDHNMCGSWRIWQKFETHPFLKLVMLCMQMYISNLILLSAKIKISKHCFIYGHIYKIHLDLKGDLPFLLEISHLLDYCKLCIELFV